MIYKESLTVGTHDLRAVVLWVNEKLLGEIMQVKNLLEEIGLVLQYL
jgi:hypothetical protein